MHVCNDRSRFIDFQPSQSRCKTGDGFTDTIGTGTVVISMEKPNRKGTISVKLGDVMYAPGFHTNIVSERRLSDRGLIFDRLSDTLVFREQSGELCQFARVLSVHPAWLLEYNPAEQKGESGLDPHNFAIPKLPPKKSILPLRNTASAARWHQRLGHLYWEKLGQLPKLVDGVDIAGPIQQREVDDPHLCSTYQQSKAQSQISRRYRDDRKLTVHFDLIQVNAGFNGDKWVSHFYVEKTHFHTAWTHKGKNEINTFI